MRWWHRDACWRPCPAALPKRPPPWVRRLIGVKGSLTERLERLGKVQVRLLGQGIERPSADEAMTLGVDRRRRAWLREVILECDGGPRVYARSVLPGRVSGPLAALPRLGEQPMGRLIFAAPDVVRGPLAVAQLKGSEPLAMRLNECAEMAVEGVWARRSTLVAAQQRILVTEVFLGD